MCFYDIDEIKREEQEFKDIIANCYKFIESTYDSSFHLAKAFFEFYHLTDKKVKELYNSVDFEDVDYLEVLEVFKKNKTAKDLMVFMKSFSKAKTPHSHNVEVGIKKAKNFHNRKKIIHTLIIEAGLKEERVDAPSNEMFCDRFIIKDITEKENELICGFFEEGTIHSIYRFCKLGIVLIYVDDWYGELL